MAYRSEPNRLFNVAKRLFNALLIRNTLKLFLVVIRGISAIEEE